MSKIISKLELVNAVDGEIGWRKKELKIIKDNIPSKDSSLQRAILRSAIPILYAHWEGFTKKSCEFYLEYVSNRSIKNRELKPQFISLSLSREIKKVEIRSMEEKTNAVKYLIDCLDQNAEIPINNIIQTKSNLKYTVFKDIIFILGLELSQFECFESLINDLVETRNTIAHGTGHKVIYSTYIQMNDDIINLMEILRTEIENSAVLEKYKLA
jgi:hypothetical protein